MKIELELLIAFILYFERRIELSSSYQTDRQNFVFLLSSKSDYGIIPIIRVRNVTKQY